MTKQPDSEIFKEAEYGVYLNKYPDMVSKIKGIFSDNPRMMCTSNEICKILNINLDYSRYVEQTLSIWGSQLCSFFEHGRIIFSKKHKKWFWLPKEHPLARDHTPKIFEPTLYVTKDKKNI